MIAYVWPLALVVLSNTVYQVCTKSVPAEISPLASLTITYLIGAVASAILFYLTSGGGSLLKEYAKLNWAPFALGLVIVGLEVGWIYAYKAGWEVSVAAVVQSAFLAVALIFVGYLIFHEGVSWNKLLGIVIVVVGLVFINLK